MNWRNEYVLLILVKYVYELLILATRIVKVSIYYSFDFIHTNEKNE